MICETTCLALGVINVTHTLDVPAPIRENKEILARRVSGFAATDKCQGFSFVQRGTA
jgi:hypothetical protein